jgi:hypothetical protein
MGNAIDNAPAADSVLHRPTPLLRIGRALAKLECLRPTGGVEDRLTHAWDGAAGEVAIVQQGAALAGAAYAVARRRKIHFVIVGPLTHEAAETLRIWGAPFEQHPSRKDALVRWPDHLPMLDEEPGLRAAAGLADELAADLAGQVVRPSAIVAPIGAAMPLYACAQKLGVRAVVVCGLVRWPDLRDGHGAPDTRDVSSAFCIEARRHYAKTHGLLASHASAAAIAVAEEIGDAVALVTAAGEREFSLDAPDADARCENGARREDGAP